MYLLWSVVQFTDFVNESPKSFLAIIWNIYNVSGTKLLTVYCRSDVKPGSSMDGDTMACDDSDILQYCT